MGGKPKPTQQQSWQEMRNYARMLTVALGGTVTERKAEE